MYESFYGLRHRPFELALNPQSVLLTAQHREALGNLEYGIRERVGITVLIGEAGTGKTTLIRTAFRRADAEAPGSTDAWAYLRNPTLQRGEFFEFLANRFGLSSAAAGSKLRLLDELERMLLAGRRAALILDEAQSVPIDLLEEVRLLANIESDSHKLLPVVLAGQPELADRLNETGLRQLKQRVALRCTLQPLTLPETASYIAYRIEEAGGKPAELFSRDSVVTVHRLSRGIPRTINVICANALLTGYAEGQRPVSHEIVDAVCRDFDLLRTTNDPPPVTQPGSVFTPGVRAPAAQHDSRTEQPAADPVHGRSWGGGRQSS